MVKRQILCNIVALAMNEVITEERQNGPTRSSFQE